MKNKYINSSIVLGLSLTMPMMFTACSFISNRTNRINNIDLYKLPNYQQNNPNYDITPNPTTKSNEYENIDHTQFISERTFSLKMVSEPNLDGKKSIGYGTGWLFAKDESQSTNNLTYYLATNLHVASILFNSGKKSYEYDESSSSYKLNQNFVFSEIQFGQIVTWENNVIGGKYSIGTTKSKLSFSETYYTQKVEKDGIDFSYLTFDMFNKMNLQDQFKVYNESIIKNATQDLAILKIDFSKRKEILNSDSLLKGTDPILRTLKAYDNNPTRFFNKEYDNNSNSNLDITVGGFPFEKNNITGKGDGSWTTSNYSSLGQIEPSGKMAGAIFNKKNWNNSIYEKDYEFIKKYYLLPSNIPFITKDYASYSNTSLQFLFKNLNLSPGSSGSMVINDKNEVIGIYWGTYNTNNGSNRESLGAVDLFINNSAKNNNGIVVIKKYNTISDFAAKINNTNLK